MTIETIESLPLCQTKDYTIFTTIPGNREQNVLQTNKLVRTIRECGNITKTSPLLVNEKYQIIDGQHRFWAFEKIAEESGDIYPIYFIVRKGLTEEDAKLMNSGSKPWSPDDYAKTYSLDGIKDYEIYLSFRERYELNADVLMKYLAPSDGDRNTFRVGEFKVEDESKSKTWCNRLEDMKTYYRDHKHRSFALAYLDVTSNRKYEHRRMMEQMEKYSNELIRVPLKNKPMREAIIEIYNKGVSEKVKFN